MTSKKFAIPPSSAAIALSYCQGKVRNVSRGIKAMQRKIQQLQEINRVLKKGGVVMRE